MPASTEYEFGTFCWSEVATTDTAAGKKFYAALFGWSTQDIDMSPGGTYTMLKLGGRDVAGLACLAAELRAQGVPAHWMSYVAVENADRSAALAKDAGGKLCAGPLDAGGMGRMAVVQDPTGATIALWQAAQTPAPALVNQPGARCWNELLTRDAGAAKRFYGRLFGWTAEDKPMGGETYTMFTNDGAPTAGLKVLTEHCGDAPAQWLTYFAVEACDGTIANARRLGGKTMFDAQDIPEVGRFAPLLDPQGACFAIIQLSQAAQAQAAGKTEQARASAPV